MINSTRQALHFRRAAHALALRSASSLLGKGLGLPIAISSKFSSCKASPRPRLCRRTNCRTQSSRPPLSSRSGPRAIHGKTAAGTTRSLLRIPIQAQRRSTNTRPRSTRASTRTADLQCCCSLSSAGLSTPQPTQPRARPSSSSRRRAARKLTRCRQSWLRRSTTGLQPKGSRRGHRRACVRGQCPDLPTLRRRRQPRGCRPSHESNACRCRTRLNSWQRHTARQRARRAS